MMVKIIREGGRQRMNKGGLACVECISGAPCFIQQQCPKACFSRKVAYKRKSSQCALEGSQAILAAGHGRQATNMVTPWGLSLWMGFFRRTGSRNSRHLPRDKTREQTWQALSPVTNMGKLLATTTVTSACRCRQIIQCQRCWTLRRQGAAFHEACRMMNMGANLAC